MTTFNEKSVGTFTSRPIKEDDGVFVPSNARYRVDDADTRTNLVPWTDMTPAVAMTITVPASANRIVQSSNRREKHILTIATDYNTDNEHNEQKDFWVKNLDLIT